jgi:hypothetical protein
VRWACIEAVGNYRAKGNEKLRADYTRIAERRGKYKARVAVARKLLTYVYYALRDGEVRCLSTPAAAASASVTDRRVLGERRGPPALRCGRCR